ncbi:MAG: amidohydrolase, partial [Gemmatimonadales bacterium]
MRLRVLTLLVPFLLQACEMDDKADLIITGKIWTGDRERPDAQAVAIRGDSIITVGDSAEILAQFLGDETRRLDNGAGTVMPGFMDSHTHFIDGGYQLASVELRDAETPAEFTARIKAYASTLAPGEWITGGNWDHERWPGSPLPERQWIDSVTGDHPVFVSRLDGHMGLANTAALQLSGITSETPDPPGGTIVRDPRTGEPTGVLKDAAMSPVYAVMPAPSASQQDSALARAMHH